MFIIKKRRIGINYPTYFIADIAANHDGNFNKAIDLIYSAKESGADAAKFQHFKAETIVSKKTFDRMKFKFSHQKNWKKSVFEVYREASINFSWTAKLKKECDKAKIDFFTSPYDLDYVNELKKYVCAYKIGSGDITWIEFLQKIAQTNKPVILATGASSLLDVKKAVSNILKYNKNLSLMQCNTNYTGVYENFKYINLRVLNTFKKNFPHLTLGLSDHTPGHSTVLGAITLGARIIEKHYTLSNNSSGPDHNFSMNPKSWREMISRSRELELSLGSDIKKIEKNELYTSIIQRRSIHINKELKKGSKINKKDIICLRPALPGSVKPHQYNKIKNKRLIKKIQSGEILYWKNLK
jgi:sialic acid synthase SpsE